MDKSTTHKAEWVDLIDKENRVIGRASRREVRRQNLLHRGIGVLCRNSEKQVYVHRRTATKDLFPSCYDMWVGGVVSSGEDYLSAATRELEEELGVTGVPLTPLFEHLYWGDQNRSIVSCYDVCYNGPIQVQASEICWGRWMEMSELLTWAEEVPIVADGYELWQVYKAKYL